MDGLPSYKLPWAFLPSYKLPWGLGPGELKKLSAATTPSFYADNLDSVTAKVFSFYSKILKFVGIHKDKLSKRLLKTIY